MTEETGFFDNKGKKMSRAEAVSCKTELIIYRGKDGYYYLDLPDDSERIGSVTTPKINELFYYIDKFDGNLEKAYNKVWGNS